MRWCIKDLLKKWFSTKRNSFEILRKSVPYRGNSEALKIIDTLEEVSKKWAGKLPISFYIADCDIKTLEEILTKLGYACPKIERQPTSRNVYAIMVRPRG